ncbi:MAG: histidine utilization repressor [Alphaproteobacteria bacterium]|nr:histidine utilization repressor [Alphaproteobacteria bacterium]MBU1516745.1 histidine utilization repressor [Alphaproteobacteria bacterium]MBU2092439.1 histidine utilization repressor [Alphaproteobacteria bacterium]MBU2152707.1 histidine utilization repressor [Alphaproteobacteria bacterium]MBU2305641.1 histidine utilization repressor [Alphaproteobacteria bacterium]
MSDAKAATLNTRIRADISERILSGAWPPGHRIPFEHELMVQYGCSRMTVNKALAPLAESGLLVRRKRAGTFVSRPRIHSVVLDIPDIAAEVSGRGETYGYDLLSRKVRQATRREVEELDLSAPGPIVVLRCLHRAGGRPFALEERLINLESVPEAQAVDFARTAPGSWLLGHVPWTEAEHRISAANVERATAQVLGIEATAACLVLQRRTWRGTDKITHVRLIFPGDAYDLVARFAPSPGAPPRPTA